VDWSLWSLVVREQKDHLFVAARVERVVPGEYLNTCPEGWETEFRAREEIVTSIATIAREYTSDLVVGRADLALS
jgi:hypothetical protein